MTSLARRHHSPEPDPSLKISDYLNDQQGRKIEPNVCNVNVPIYAFLLIYSLFIKGRENKQDRTVPRKQHSKPLMGNHVCDCDRRAPQLFLN